MAAATREGNLITLTVAGGFVIDRGYETATVVETLSLADATILKDALVLLLEGEPAP